ncbi:MAG: P-loop NTPase, partial [Saprospiraceae bacterium]
IPLEAYGVKVMSMGFIIEPEQAVVLRGPRLGGIIKQFINDCIWPDLDYLIIDLPPGTGDIQLTLVQTLPITGAIFVTTPQEVAVIDAVKAVNMFMLENIEVPVIGIVENMSWFTPEELPDNKYYIFGKGGGAKLASISKSVLLGQLPLVQSIREGGDSGRPVATYDNSLKQKFEDLAKSVSAQIQMRKEVMG